MLEVCPTIAATKPRIEVHPLGIGGKADPARLVFNGADGAAVCASLIRYGKSFPFNCKQCKCSKIQHDHA